MSGGRFFWRLKNTCKNGVCIIYSLIGKWIRLLLEMFGDSIGFRRILHLSRGEEVLKKGIMKTIWRIVGTVYFLFFLSMYLTIPASAYIDPATTAMLTQVIAGVAITIGVVFGVFRRKIIMFFKNLSVKRMQRKIEKQNKSENQKEQR